MNIKEVLTAALVSVSSSVIAQEFVVPDAGFKGAKTRAQVAAELAAAASAGSLDIRDDTYPVIANVGPPRTRQEVIAELNEAARNGTLHWVDHTYPVIAQSKVKARTREEVVAELVEFHRAYPKGFMRQYYAGGN